MGLAPPVGVFLLLLFVLLSLLLLLIVRVLLLRRRRHGFVHRRGRGAARDGYGLLLLSGGGQRYGDGRGRRRSDGSRLRAARGGTRGHGRPGCALHGSGEVLGRRLLLSGLRRLRRGRLLCRCLWLCVATTGRRGVGARRGGCRVRTRGGGQAQVRARSGTLQDGGPGMRRGGGGDGRGGGGERLGDGGGSVDGRGIRSRGAETRGRNL